MSERDVVIDCDNCGQPVDPISTRWRCTRCGFKLNCCEGAPLPAHKGPSCEGPKAGAEGAS